MSQDRAPRDQDRARAAADRKVKGEVLLLPDGSIDTGMPITSRRAGPTPGDGEVTA